MGFSQEYPTQDSVDVVSKFTKLKAKPPVLTNHESIPKILKEFYDAARYYRVQVIEPLDKLKGVYFIESNLNFLGGISPDGQFIFLNSELLEYPHLTKVILFRQFGNIYGLNKNILGHHIMGDHWELDYDHEFYARKQLERPWMKKHFFESLHKAYPILKQI